MPTTEPAVPAAKATTKKAAVAKSTTSAKSAATKSATKAASAKPAASKATAKPSAKKTTATAAGAKPAAKKTTAKRKTKAAPKSRAADTGPIRNLVIVESPAKARTIGNILGRDYTLKASVGHVRDLPKSKLGVDVDAGFAPTYLVPLDKRAVVKEIREAARRAERVYLATDPDREGEAISWHLVQAAGLENMPHSRVVFHEITREAIEEAFRHPRPIDEHLVDAQQARRVLDRLVGYRISPVLWRKVRRGLSAGRVQSVALRIVVEREREVLNFTPMEYWSIEARLAKGGTVFGAMLQGPAGGKAKDFTIPDGAAAAELQRKLQASAYAVTSVRKRPQIRRPAAPFITSTLQQEASRRLGFTPTRTMAVAQQLYEGVALGPRGEAGLITYMRTDSTNVAASAVMETREFIAEKFGDAFVPEKPRVYTKKARGAQEAHEAIRPTSIRREPDSLARFLTRDQLRLYTLIWQRMLASQMADAIFDTTSVDITATAGPDAFLLRATDSALRFAGFRRVYIEATDDGDADDDRPSLPGLVEGDTLALRDLVPEQHFTQPPPRYTEASLVKALEENGIGRPSTYAPTMATLKARGYVKKDGNRVLPDDLGFVVNDMLVEHFPGVLDIGFTAEMESELDEIASGERMWEPVIREFYVPLEEAVRKAEDAPAVQEMTDKICPKSGHPLAVKWGRFGRFLACTGYPECRHTEPLPEEAEEQAKAATGEFCDTCGGPMEVRRGRFGPFLVCPVEGHGTRSIAKKTGVRCPLDGGDIVEKKSKRGRVFYGCNRYPACEFSTWSPPLPEPCPDCGSLVVQVGRGDNAKCTQCGWKGERPPPASAAAAAAPEPVGAR